MILKDIIHRENIIKTENEIIEHFKTLDHEEMLMITEDQVPGNLNEKLFTNDEIKSYVHLSLHRDINGLGNLYELVGVRKEKLLAIYRKTLN